MEGIWQSYFRKKEKEGRPEHVKERMEGLKRAYKSSGNVDLIDSLVFCFGKFPVEELNCLIHYSGYGQTFYKRFVLRGS